MYALSPSLSRSLPKDPYQKLLTSLEKSIQTCGLKESENIVKRIVDPLQSLPLGEFQTFYYKERKFTEQYLHSSKKDLAGDEKSRKLNYMKQLNRALHQVAYSKLKMGQEVDLPKLVEIKKNEIKTMSSEKASFVLYNLVELCVSTENMELAIEILTDSLSKSSIDEIDESDSEETFSEEVFMGEPRLLERDLYLAFGYIVSSLIKTDPDRAYQMIMKFPENKFKNRFTNYYLADLGDAYLKLDRADKAFEYAKQLEDPELATQLFISIVNDSYETNPELALKAAQEIPNAMWDNEKFTAFSLVIGSFRKQKDFKKALETAQMMPKDPRSSSLVANITYEMNQV